MATGTDTSSLAAFVRERPFGIALAVLVAVLFVDLFRKLGAGGITVADLAGFLKDGTVLGLSLGLAGIGLAMTYSILNFANFAHGDYITIGGVAGWIATFLVSGLGSAELESLALLTASSRTLGVSVATAPVAIVVGLLVAVVLTAAMALLIDRLVFRPMRGQRGISLLIASVGVALAVRYLLVFTLQSGPRGLTAGPATPSWDLAVGSGTVTVTAHELTLAALAVALMLGTHVLLRYTTFGTAMRAMADNEDLAQVSGIPTERVIRTTWLLGAGLTGAAGFLIALERGALTTSFGWQLLLLVFAAVILGGIGSVYGAMVGGLVIGLASRLSLVWLPESFIIVAAFVVMIVILLVRPEGLLGGVTTV
ncbi:branched-chain amino acid ABC transporter permease [Halorientalis sp.]|jgi:branched-chain amino acid transport system permease protein|uniref:branched-chain amino acid ABC transporter permease n=1 Tax=Halorientalis sp. TaxID=1931229 RepID=UPI002634A187|nr:branched-chain amino acid ABC transporter permease [Halorientalis sp.]